MKPQNWRRARCIRSLLLVLGTASGLAWGAPSLAETEQVPLFQVTVPNGDHSMFEIHPTRTWIKGQLAAEIRSSDGTPLGNVEVRLVPYRARSGSFLPTNLGEMSLEEIQADNRFVPESQRVLVATTNQQGEVVFTPSRPGWYSLQLDWSRAAAIPKVRVDLTYRQIKRATALLPVVPSGR